MKLHTRHWMIAVLIGMLLLVVATLALGGGQRSPREHEALPFAHTIVTQLETAPRATSA